MKICVIISLLSLTGCSKVYYDEPNYAGKAPYYVMSKPHPVDCGCCAK